MNTLALEQSPLYRKALGCLLGGIIGDAIGTPTENMHYRDIETRYGWLADFDSDGTDDTILKHLLADALVRTGGYATLDDWAATWLDNWQEIFGSKLAKFYISVLHTAHKLNRHSTPRMAALGNMPSSSSAMCISPVGIVNACNPRQAALQTYNLASLIHIHDVGYCQDGAVAMAAAVAAAFNADATVESVLRAAVAYILPASGAELLDRIHRALSLARQTGNFVAFRAAVYERSDDYFCRIACDSRETVPMTLALWLLAAGDLERAVTYGANFGRDADTIASMAGAIAGAYGDVDSVRPDWVAKIERYSSRDQRALALQLAATALARHDAEGDAHRRFRATLTRA